MQNDEKQPTVASPTNEMSEFKRVVRRLIQFQRFV